MLTLATFGQSPNDAKLLRTAAIATCVVITLVVAGRLIARDLAPATPSTRCRLQP